MASSRDELPFSKKRVALRQMGREDENESHEEDSSTALGTFRRASEEVLAERRIVKIRRNSVSPSSAPNPFAAIRLTSPSCTPASIVTPPVVLLSSNCGHSTKAVVGQDELEGPMAGDRLDVPELLQVADVREQQAIDDGGSKQQMGKNFFETPVEDSTVANTAVAEAETEFRIDVKNLISNLDDGNNVVMGEGKTRVGEPVGPSSTSSETFEQLSSAKNAFAGSFGTGFSSTLSASSTSSELYQGPTAFAPGQLFMFGTQRFGSTLSFTVDETRPSSLESKLFLPGSFSSISSVFGKSNGSGSSPLFGSAASAAIPGSGHQKPAVVSLQEVRVETGEEKEKAVFTADAALFEFLDGGWKERGRGELKVNVPEEKQKRPRLIMRSKGNYRLLLNASLFPDMKLSKMDNSGISFVCANSAAEWRSGLTTYAVKLKDGVLASEFAAVVHAHKGNINAEPKTPESSPNATERSLHVEAGEVDS